MGACCSKKKPIKTSESPSKGSKPKSKSNCSVNNSVSVATEGKGVEETSSKVASNNKDTGSSDLASGAIGAGEGKLEIMPGGKLIKAPNDDRARQARISVEENLSQARPDRRRREMVHEVIYKQGGFIYDKKTRKQKWIEPGTPLPGGAEVAADELSHAEVSEISACDANLPNQ